MAKKSNKTYKINSEIINTELTFGTIKEAREFIATVELPDEVKNSKETVALGTVDGYKGEDQVNTTAFRFEKNAVKFGRTSKIESETEIVFTPSARLNDSLNTEDNAEAPAEDEIENADDEAVEAPAEDEIENADETVENAE